MYIAERREEGGAGEDETKTKETHQRNISPICLVVRGDLDHRPISLRRPTYRSAVRDGALESRDEKIPAASRWRSNLSTGRNKRRDNAHSVYNSLCVGYLMGIKQMVRDLSREKAEGQRSSVECVFGTHEYSRVDTIISQSPFFDQP